MRMQNLREGKTEEEIKNEKEEAEEGMKKMRAKRTDEEWKEENQKARKGMQKVIDKKSDEESEFYIISKMHKMRESREKRSGKEHLEHNLKAKKGMLILECEGPQKSFSRRFSGKREELSEWQKYIR